MIYEIAQTMKEAVELAAEGYGYDSREMAEKALANGGMDPFYRNKLRIFAVSEKAREAKHDAYIL